MEEPHALIERRGHVLIVTMNRPQARNALSGPMMELMRQAWDTVDSDPEIRVCVLTGAGGAFCAGADLKAMTSSHPGDRFQGGDLDVSVIEPLLKGRRLSKPLIAAVEGPAVAGGTEILQACDIRVAGASARFGVSEARWGLFPLGGSAVRLPRQIPYTVAADLLLTGRHITAAEALSIGLIGHVVPDGQALEAALEIAAAIAANGPVAVRAILRVIRETEGMAENEAFALEAKVGMAVFASEDAKEGPRAFAEKRRPGIQGPLAFSPFLPARLRTWGGHCSFRGHADCLIFQPHWQQPEPLPGGLRVALRTASRLPAPHGLLERDHAAMLGISVLLQTPADGKSYRPGGGPQWTLDGNMPAGCSVRVGCRSSLSCRSCAVPRSARGPCAVRC